MSRIYAHSVHQELPRRITEEAWAIFNENAPKQRIKCKHYNAPILKIRKELDLDARRSGFKNIKAMNSWLLKRFRDVNDRFRSGKELAKRYAAHDPRKGSGQRQLDLQTKRQAPESVASQIDNKRQVVINGPVTITTKNGRTVIDFTSPTAELTFTT